MEPLTEEEKNAIHKLTQDLRAKAIEDFKQLLRQKLDELKKKKFDPEGMATLYGCVTVQELEDIIGGLCK
jgi:uncharacterized protein YnzC (UPF0291/DUF896 family)